MEVNDKIMYHFHQKNRYDNMWEPGNEILVDNNFESLFGKILKEYSIGVQTNDNYVQFNRVISHYLEEEQDKETYIDLLKEAEHIIRGGGIFQREMALEIVRRLCYPELPSRRNSVWLCDEKSGRHWKSSLEEAKDLSLYRVSVSGNLFKSSDVFLPDEYLRFEDMIIKAHKYWNPKFKNSTQERQAEYLFQGKIKILEKIRK